MYGKHQCDFYFPDRKLYVEVTGYNKNSEKYDAYMDRIKKKEYHVKNILKSEFLFIEKTLTKKETREVRSFMSEANKSVNYY